MNICLIFLFCFVLAVARPYLVTDRRPHGHVSSATAYENCVAVRTPVAGDRNSIRIGRSQRQLSHDSKGH